MAGGALWKGHGRERYRVKVAFLILIRFQPEKLPRGADWLHT